MNRNLNHALRVIKSGGIVIFPTDTAFGIGCRLDNEKSIKRLFKIRRRPLDKAVPVLVSSISMAQDYVLEIDYDVKGLAKKYWPGGLTLVLPCKKEKVPAVVRGGGNSIGVRIPDHISITTIIRKLGVPILAPSANFSGGKTPFKLSEIDTRLTKLVDYVLPGRCKIKETSTVLDVTGRPWKMVRFGAVKIKL